ncbi:MAG: DUF3467 domain-containing protein [Pseudomonadota bacterium]
MLKNESSGLAAHVASPRPVAASVPLVPRWDDAAQAHPGAVPTVCDYAEVPEVREVRGVPDADGADTRITLLFGQRTASADGATDHALSHRIALTPFAAKRLAQTLAQGVVAYEQRFGAIMSA